ncbi:isoaspartyl peptidase/L-asparaginase [Legionella sp. km772]|nr:isoaspartyl peptidase/L-asparaginase [Legionella sp. km772]
MKNIAIVVHGGCGQEDKFLKNNWHAYEKALSNAALEGYKLLEKGSSALEAVEQAARFMEDNPLFNAGRGSSLNSKGEVEMDASIMDGKNQQAGAVSMVRNVKNPISLARCIMQKTRHAFFSGYGALEVAKDEHIILKPDSYFITEHQYNLFQEASNQDSMQEQLTKKIHGTIGAVALDYEGNLAAGASTGGTPNNMPGRIGDSCIIGAGCYANNNTCAVAGTGTGEYLINRVIAYTISLMVEFKMPLQEACEHVLHQRNKDVKDDLGVISLNAKGEVGIAFNTPILKRAWIGFDKELHVRIK